MFFSFSGKASAATYYLNCDAGINGSGIESSPYNSIASAKTAAGNNDTVYIRGNCAEGNLNDTGTSQTWTNWQGYSNPTINSTTNSALVPSTNSTYSNIIFDGGNQNSQDVLYAASGATGWTVNNCEMKRGRRGIVLGNGSGTIATSRIYGNGHAGGYQNIAVAGTYIIRDNRFEAPRYIDNGGTSQLRIETAGTYYIYNNSFVGSFGNSINLGNNAYSVTIKNNFFYGYGAGITNTWYAINGAATPTKDISNNYYTTTPRQPTQANLGLNLVTSTDSQRNKLPGLTAPSPAGKTIIRMDDWNQTRYDLGWYNEIVTWARDNHVPLVHFIDGDTPITWASVNALGELGAGYYKVGFHGYRHTSLSSTLLPNAITFSVYPAGAKFSFDGTTFILKDGGGSEVLNVNVVTSPSHDTMQELVAAINGVSGFSGTTVANTSLNGEPSNSMKSYVETLVSSLSSGNVALDYGTTSSRYFDNEISAWINAVRANVDASYITPYLGYPGGAYNSTLTKWLQNNQAVNVKIAFAGTNTTDLLDPRVGFSLYEVAGVAASNTVGLKGATPDATRENTRAWAGLITASGAIGTIWFHDSTEVTTEHLSAIIDGLADFGIEPSTCDEVYSYITNSAVFDGTDIDSDGSGILESWKFKDTATYTPDLRLTALSSAIDAGTSVGLTTDFAGNKIYGLPDIGGYEYQPPHTIGTNNINISAGARIYGDGKFRDVGTTGASTADIKITPSGGTFTETTSPIPAWLDVAVSTWSNTGNHHKTWTESNAEALLTNTDHTIGDLENNKYYNITVDSHSTNLTGTGCVVLNDKLSCKSNGSGKIAFTYGGTYTTHTFDVAEGDNTAPVTTASPTGNTFNTDQTVTLTCDDGSGTGCDKTYYTLTGIDPTTSSTQYSSAISIPSNATTILKYFSTDLTGNSEAIKSQTYIIDTIAPDTTIDSYPNALINSNSATFTFSASETATFQCKIDSGAYATCASPKNYASLAEGAHTFYVKAIDSATNEDATPPSYVFTVDTQAPTISNAAPDNQTFSNTTTSTNITLDTSETATCKYSTTSGTDYILMTAFDSTNNTSHSTFISGLNIGTIYDYYIKCQDTATNESGEEHLTFSIAPLENNNISLENIKIKVGRETNKFKDTIRIAKNKLKLKQTDENLANGTVKIYKDNKRIDTIDINADGSWDKILKLKDEFSGWIKIRQYDQFGTFLSTDKAKIKVDTEDPKFNEVIPERMTIGRNRKIQFTATDDNSGIDYYKVKLADIRDWRQQNEDFYQIPEDVPNGTYDLFIRAYDKTGNYAEEKTTLNIVRFKNSVNLTQVPLNLDSPTQNTESQIQNHTDKNTDTAPNSSSSSNSPSLQPQSQSSTFHWYNPFTWF